jgi:hypothetical protein
MSSVIRIILPGILSLLLAACGDSLNVTGTPHGPGSLIDVNADGQTSVNEDNLALQLAALPLGSISAEENEGLVYMREEEKLAHDVYALMFDRWGISIFSNIASSEITHTEAIRSLLERYQLNDPVSEYIDGEFQNSSLQGLYDSLIASGSASAIDALLVGAEIEEIDLIDIQTQLNRVTENDDIILVYQNLMKGSRNHLRAFVRVLEGYGVSYQPGHLEQSVYDEIIQSDVERS